jgi:hypothetical protein
VPTWVGIVDALVSAYHRGDGLFGSVTSKLGGVGAFYTTKVGGLEMGLSISRMDNSS